MTADKTASGTTDGATGSATVDSATADGPRRPVLTASLIVVGLLAALGSWLLYGAVTRTLTTPADPAELTALDTRLTEIRDAARPIAAAFAAEPASGTVDIGAYRTRVEALRHLVDSTSDLSATSPDALEVRDLILTGGAQVAAGMEAALDAAASDEASATGAAAIRVDEGLANLDEARTRLDLLLGRLKPVQTG
jgi:hypothetical protein